MTGSMATAPIDVIALVWLLIGIAGYGTLCIHAALSSRRAAAAHVRRLRLARQLAADPLRTVTTIIAARNEAATIVASVRSVLDQRWPHLQVIVVANGCTDSTVEQLLDAFEMTPARTHVRRPGAPGVLLGAWSSRADRRLLVLETTGAGKSDAINCGLERTRGACTCITDADSALDPDAIGLAVAAFTEGGPSIAAVSCAVDILDTQAHRRSNHRADLAARLLRRVQRVEYARAFHVGRAGFARVNALPIVSGAFGMFNTVVLRAVGGFDTSTVGEDLEIVLRIHDRIQIDGGRPRLVFLHEPLCRTLAPGSLQELRVQRRRWQRGLRECVTRHRSLIFDHRRGSVGMFSMPFMGVFELLAPVLELLGVILLVVLVSHGSLSAQVAIAFGLVSIGMGLLVSTVGLLLGQVATAGRSIHGSRDVMVLFAAAVAEQFGYRQLTAWWRIRGLLEVRRSRVSGWQPQRRRLADQGVR
jgi:cellulose synthase/poly-beta-1,6-N-acetylglucosamine synthase-like glycosyltransferase